MEKTAFNDLIQLIRIINTLSKTVMGVDMLYCIEHRNDGDLSPAEEAILKQHMENLREILL